MIFPSLDFSFGCITEMGVRWDEFKSDVILFEGLAHVVRSFAVEYMEPGSNTVVAKTFVEKFSACCDCCGLSVW